MSTSDYREACDNSPPPREDEEAFRLRSRRSREIDLFAQELHSNRNESRRVPIRVAVAAYRRQLPNFCHPSDRWIMRDITASHSYFPRLLDPIKVRNRWVVDESAISRMEDWMWTLGDKYVKEGGL